MANTETQKIIPLSWRRAATGEGIEAYCTAHNSSTKFKVTGGYGGLFPWRASEWTGRAFKALGKFATQRDAMSACSRANADAYKPSRGFIGGR